MHSELDLKEVWRNLEKGNTCVLWCEGVGANARKKLAFSSSDSEEEVPNPRKRKKLSWPKRLRSQRLPLRRPPRERERGEGRRH